MGQRIVVINPNSNRDVTAAMDRNLDNLRFSDGPTIDCMTLEGAPPGIETARHADQVVGPLCDLVAREEGRTDAFVIACFGDPGLASVRETTAKPVIGIGEAGITAALNYGEHYGIVTNLPEDVKPGLRQIRALGLGARLAGIEAAGVAVVDLDDVARSKAGLLAAAKHLKDKGADVLVLGCAGMVPYGSDLEAETGVPVIDPIHAAGGLALTMVQAKTVFNFAMLEAAP